MSKLAAWKIENHIECYWDRHKRPIDCIEKHSFRSKSFYFLQTSPILCKKMSLMSYSWIWLGNTWKTSLQWGKNTNCGWSHVNTHTNIHQTHIDLERKYEINMSVKHYTMNEYQIQSVHQMMPCQHKTCQCGWDYTSKATRANNTNRRNYLKLQEVEISMGYWTKRQFRIPVRLQHINH